MLPIKFISKYPINKGWSCDQKFRVTTEDNTKYLLRVTPFDKSANRSEMFRMQQKSSVIGNPHVQTGGVWNVQGRYIHFADLDRW